MIQHFSEAKFKKKENVITICEALKLLLLSDRELPVRVEAAISIESFLSSQDIAEKHCVTYVRDIVQGKRCTIEACIYIYITYIIDSAYFSFCGKCFLVLLCAAK